MLTLKMCLFCTNKVIFLGFVMNSNSVEVDEEKVKAIQEWPRPTSISNVRSFHGLASFCRRFVKDFNILTAPLIEIIYKKRKLGSNGEKNKKKLST